MACRFIAQTIGIGNPAFRPDPAPLVIAAGPAAGQPASR
jgi:hypothetical protein